MNELLAVNYVSNNELINQNEIVILNSFENNEIIKNKFLNFLSD
jgi:hypothetical protein